jgi:hypothetical protein
VSTLARVKSHAVFLCLCLAAQLGAADALPAIRFEEIASPTSAASCMGPSVAVGPDNVVWLTWLERDGADTSLKFSMFEPGAKQWSAARVIARGENWFINAADFPVITIGPKGAATAVWFVNNPAPSAPAAAAHDHHGPGYHARFSRTTDGGRTWSTPVKLTRESDSVEFVSLATLADGRVLAVWLDGRAKKTGGKAQQLFSRIVGASEADVRVDASVCDCCQTSLTAFPDGTALLAYRGRADDEVRDIRVTRFRDGRWDAPRSLNSDAWRIAGCPVNGPQLASDGGRVAAAWFTAADDDPRVLASISSDAGGRFLTPLRLSEKKPLGRVATTLLHDGAMLVSFVDADGALWLRRISPDFAAADAVKLNAAERGRIKGFPRMALLRDYRGGKEPAQVIAAFTPENSPGVRTLLVTIPEGDLLEAEKNCDCGSSSEEPLGFPIRGSLVETQTSAGVARVNHVEVPGIFASGVRPFRAAPEVLARVAEPGREFLGRIEKRGEEWWLVEARLIASAR